jgi:DNA mismatch endonuclease, patch repair protein
MSAATRSDIMRAVRSRDTSPEMIVRRLAHSLGYRYRLHRRDLPGSPDLVFPSRRKLIFVQGCFWHGHACARGARAPKTNAAYWSAKISRNETRDAEQQALLARDGWRLLIVWECQTRDLCALKHTLRSFLD